MVQTRSMDGEKKEPEENEIGGKKYKVVAWKRLDEINEEEKENEEFDLGEYLDEWEDHRIEQQRKFKKLMKDYEWKNRIQTVKNILNGFLAGGIIFFLLK